MIGRVEEEYCGRKSWRKNRTKEKNDWEREMGCEEYRSGKIGEWEGREEVSRRRV
jgi:hypothetical protein